MKKLQNQSKQINQILKKKITKAFYKLIKRVLTSIINIGPILSYQKSLDFSQINDVGLSKYIDANKIYEYDGRKFEFIENNPFNSYLKELYDNEFIKPFLLIPEQIEYNNKSYFFYETIGIKPISSYFKDGGSLHLNPTECTTVVYGLLAALAFLSNLPQEPFQDLRIAQLQLNDNLFIYDDEKEKIVKLRLQKTESSASNETLIRQFADILLNLADEEPTKENFFLRNSWLYYRLISIQKGTNDNPSFTSLYNDFMSQYRDFMILINFKYTGTDEDKFREFRIKNLDKYECFTQKAFIDYLYKFFGFHGQFKLIYMFTSLNTNPTTNTPEAFIKAIKNSSPDLIATYFKKNPYKFGLNQPDHQHYKEIIAEIKRYQMIPFDQNDDLQTLNVTELLHFTPYLSPIFYFLLIHDNDQYEKDERYQAYEKLRTQFYCTGKGNSITDANIQCNFTSENSDFWTCKIKIIEVTSNEEYAIKRPKFNANENYYFFFFYQPIRLLYVLNRSSDNVFTEQFGIYQSAVIMKKYDSDLKKFREEKMKNTNPILFRKL